MDDISAKPPTSMAGFSLAQYDFDGVNVAVYSIGKGPEFVFLHGTGTFTGFEFARALASKRKVIIPHNPNFGESGDDPTIDTVEDYVLHYLSLFDRLGLDQFDLGGFSLGGWLAAEIATRVPQRLRRLVLVAPAGLVVERARAPELSEIAPPELPSYLAHDPTAALRYFPPAPDDAFNARLGREIGAYAQLVRNNPQGNPKLARWLRRITVPTLLLWGAADRMRPAAQADAWLAGLPHGRLQLVPSTGHLVLEETPAAVRFISDFLAAEPSKNRGFEPMSEMTAGVTRSKEGLDGAAWNILGQTYTPKEECEASFSWHALLPPGTFVPPHIHPTQDEFIYMIEGRLDLELGNEKSHAGPGDLIRLPRGKPHGLYNNASSDVRCLFWVAPARRLRALFEKLHNLSDPAEVVRISAEHEVNFLPPK
jgi:pimeloyl-ACP methyl ester carboxylesterase/mannose-6-phosphate isomerase-like protein (cupin superfamily)